MRAGGGDRYFHRNQQYSITALTDSSGNVTERYAYTAYGKLLVFDSAGAALTNSADNNRYTYTGREWDEAVELYHYRARMFDAESGRFCSKDPTGYQDSRNQYLFEAANPSGYLDPSGLARVLPNEAKDLNGCGCGYSPNPPKPGTYWGYVACDGKGGFQAVGAQAEDGHADFECWKKCFANHCTKEHEDHHIDQFKLICPKTCQLGIATWNIPFPWPGCHIPIRLQFNRPKGGAIGIDNTKGVRCLDKVECYANRIELRCLNKLFLHPNAGATKCKGRTCKWWLKKFFDERRKTVENKYGCKGLKIRLPDLINR